MILNFIKIKELPQIAERMVSEIKLFMDIGIFFSAQALKIF